MRKAGTTGSDNAVAGGTDISLHGPRDGDSLPPTLGMFPSRGPIEKALLSDLEIGVACVAS